MRKKKTTKEKPLRLNMTFEEAMQKALNTKIPKGAGLPENIGGFRKKKKARG